MRRLATGATAGAVLAAFLSIDGAAQQAASPLLVQVRPIAPPAAVLPAEADSASVTKFSFIAYGDTRGLLDGTALQPDHSVVVDGVLARITSLATTPFPIRFVLQSGDAVLNGTAGTQWNVSFSPIIERLTRDGNVPYFLAAGNHDVTNGPAGDPLRALGLHNTLAAMSKLIPPEGSPRRLNGYATYAFGFGNLFAIAIDSNIASDPIQLAWVTDQLDQLDRSRYRHVIAFFHHPLFSSGPHGGVSPDPIATATATPTVPVSDNAERQTLAMRSLYVPLFRKHHVRMTITGHDHLYDHFVERYTDGGVSHRRDDLVTGGGGAPIYTYRGEPDMQVYLVQGADHNVRVQHLMKPGATPAENPHHFVVVHVDGDRLSLEVIAAGAVAYMPYGGESRFDLDDPLESSLERAR
jgi:calcineurin-like phosphoesterase family protein